MIMYGLFLALTYIFDMCKAWWSCPHRWAGSVWQEMSALNRNHCVAPLPCLKSLTPCFGVIFWCSNSIQRLLISCKYAPNPRCRPCRRAPHPLRGFNFPLSQSRGHSAVNRAEECIVISRKCAVFSPVCCSSEVRSSKLTVNGSKKDLIIIAYVPGKALPAVGWCELHLTAKVN